MPQVRAGRYIRLDPETAFAFSQTTGEFRLKWDPFISAQGWLDGATAAGKGVRTRTVSRMGLVMVSEYVSFVRACENAELVSEFRALTSL